MERISPGRLKDLDALISMNLIQLSAWLELLYWLASARLPARKRHGRVLVERVEGIASKREWQRGYEEINQFERMLVADGVRIVKCFLHITPAEQIRRFKDRLTNPLKRWKLSYEDLRNQSRWTDYEVAIEDMIERTSTRNAPWHVVPGHDKPYGRLAAFTILIDRLGEGLRLEPRPVRPQDR